MYSIHRSCYIEVENIHMTHDMVLWYFPTRTFSKWFRANSILLLARACPFAVLCHVCSALSALCSAIFNLQIASIRSNDSIRSPHRRRERAKDGKEAEAIHCTKWRLWRPFPSKSLALKIATREGRRGDWRYAGRSEEGGICCWHWPRPLGGPWSYSRSFFSCRDS